MKLAIVGSRDFYDCDLLDAVVSPLNPSMIISGGAIGADSLAEDWALVNMIPTNIFHADWDDMSEPCVIGIKDGKKYNKLAGHKRNQLIVDECDFCLVFWNGHSKGTKDTITKLKKSGKPFSIITF